MARVHNWHVLQNMPFKEAGSNCFPCSSCIHHDILYELCYQRAGDWFLDLFIEHTDHKKDRYWLFAVHDGDIIEMDGINYAVAKYADKDGTHAKVVLMSEYRDKVFRVKDFVRMMCSKQHIAYKFSWSVHYKSQSQQNKKSI